MLKFQVQGIVADKLDTTIDKYRDNVDLQSFIDGVQQNVSFLWFLLYSSSWIWKLKITSDIFFIHVKIEHSPPTCVHFLAWTSTSLEFPV